jgi:aspartyl-tRNA(Asn)/glutamyl-tRNA(Gln) amidotransferase subunit C
MRGSRAPAGCPSADRKFAYSFPIVFSLRQRWKVRMANITKADVEYVAGLAQLTLDDATKARLVAEMGEILGYMDKLNELDTTGVEPMMHVLEMSNVFRDDVVTPSLPREIALMNAPKTDGEYFLVPRILDTE